MQSTTEPGQRRFGIVIFHSSTARAVTHTLDGYYASPTGDWAGILG